MPDELPPKMIELISSGLFRLVWWTHLDPTKRAAFADELFDVICEGIVGTFESGSKKMGNAAERSLAKLMARSIIDKKIGGFANKLPQFGDETFDKLAKNIVKHREDSSANSMFASQYERFSSRIANLSESLISAVKIIHEEFIIWLKTHPDHTDLIHADAFEQLSGEILSQHGFDVQFTGRIKNMSADLMAVRKDENDQEVKYLIECKRYGAGQKVDLNIVNAVIGASCRARVKHAMLLTTSSFTANSFQVLADFEDIRLELHDGKQITEWLSDYQFKNLGLWLPEGWEDQWRVDE